MKDPMDTLAEEAAILGPFPVPHHATESAMLGKKRNNIKKKKKKKAWEVKLHVFKVSLLLFLGKKIHSTFCSPDTFIMFTVSTSKILWTYAESPQETGSSILAAAPVQLTGYSEK